MPPVHYILISPSGPVFGSKDNFHGLAIFLDTYPNDEATEVSGDRNLLWGLLLIVILVLICAGIVTLTVGELTWAFICRFLSQILNTRPTCSLLKILNPDFFIMQRVFPYISAMVNNGSLPYDHSKDGRWTELAGCTADIRNQNHDTFLAVRYSRGRLTVSWSGPLHWHLFCWPP